MSQSNKAEEQVNLREVDNAQDPQALLRKKLLFMFACTPAITHSMIQTSFGYSVSVRDWKPVLEELIADRIVVKEEFQLETPLRQYRTITRLRLASMPLPDPSALYEVLLWAVEGGVDPQVGSDEGKDESKGAGLISPFEGTVKAENQEPNLTSST